MKLSAWHACLAAVVATALVIDPGFAAALQSQPGGAGICRSASGPCSAEALANRLSEFDHSRLNATPAIRVLGLAGFSLGLLTMGATHFIVGDRYEWLQMTLGLTGIASAGVTLASLLSSAIPEHMAKRDIQALTEQYDHRPLNLHAVTHNGDTVWSWINLPGNGVYLNSAAPTRQAKAELQRLIRTLTDRQKQALIRIVLEHEDYRRGQQSEIEAKLRATQAIEWWFLTPSDYELTRRILRPSLPPSMRAIRMPA